MKECYYLNYLMGNYFIPCIMTKCLDFFILILQKKKNHTNRKILLQEKSYAYHLKKLWCKLWKISANCNENIRKHKWKRKKYKGSKYNKNIEDTQKI